MDRLRKILYGVWTHAAWGKSLCPHPLGHMDNTVDNSPTIMLHTLKIGRAGVKFNITCFDDIKDRSFFFFFFFFPY